MSGAGVTDPHIHSFITRYQGPGPRYGDTLYLQTSPEFPMKRLLAAGSGSIYQFARVFRNGEAGRLHSPEFTLLEWYRVGFDHHQLMDEVAELVLELLVGRYGDELPQERLSYRELFRQHLGLDPLRAMPDELRATAHAHNMPIPAGMDLQRAQPWLDMLLTHCLEPGLGRGRLTFVYDYPIAQAALARIRPDDPPVAERFELYLEGIELANGFHELTDPIEQGRRFEQENRRRSLLGLPTVPIDGRLLEALAHLPACSGVALGFDRLCMLEIGALELDAVLPLPFDQS